MVILVVLYLRHSTADMGAVGVATQDTWELVLAAAEAGDVSLGQIANLFKVHRTALYWWIQTHKDPGRLVPFSFGIRSHSTGHLRRR